VPTTFNHITVPSQDLKAAIAFYTGIGMKLIEHEPQHHAHFENKEHEVIFTAYYNPKLPEQPVTVYFETDGIEVFELRFRESVLSPTIYRDWGGKDLTLQDPDGNNVVLYQKDTPTTVTTWQK